MVNLKGIGNKLFVLKDLVGKKRLLYDNNFMFFSKDFFRQHFSIDFCQFHTELFDDLSADIPNKRMVRIAPRGHGKTTIVAMAYPLWCLAIQRKKSILIIGSNQTLANEKMQGVINEIEGNDLLLSYYPHLKPKKDRKNQYVKYTDSHIIFENGSQIVAKGMGSAVRGMKPRPDLIVIDDPEKDADLNTDTIRERNKLYFDNVVRYLGAPGLTLDIILIDTLKHFDSLIKYVFDKPGWDSKRYSAVIDDEHKKVLWDKVYCYAVDEMTDFEKSNYNKRGSSGYEGIRQPFYGKFFHKDTPSIVGLSDDNPTSFIQEFLSMPVLPEAMPLRKELWQYFDYTDEWFSEIKNKIGALDLSMGKKGSDFQAISIIGNKKNDYFLIDASLSRYDLIGSENNENSLAGLCVNFIARYGLKAFIVEDNGAQGLFINSVRKRLNSQGILCNLIARKSTGDKHERIRGTLGMMIQNKSFYIRRDFEKVYGDFMRQFEYFPKADHDDAPDVTNMAVMAIQRAKASKV